jgi:hypothetical protein
MPTKTYYAKLDCLTNTSNTVVGSEYYKSFMDFMSYLTASNVATLIAWNSGSSAVSASFNQRGYWDQSNPFGSVPYSIWRFNTSSTRNWEWYISAVGAWGGNFDATNGNIAKSYNLPISGWADGNAWATVFTDTLRRGLLIQAALCVSGTSSFNPWNGNFGDGNANASLGAGNGSFRWISGSNDRTLYVLPRSNDTVGAHTADRSNHLTLGSTFATSDTTMRYHFIYDGDALLAINDPGNNSTYSLSYIGAFELRNELTGSGFGNTNFGFCMMSQYTMNLASSNNLLILGTVLGNTAGNTSPSNQWNGGFAIPQLDGSKNGIVNTIGTFINSTYQPNTINNKYEEFPIYVGFGEPPYVGLVGKLNTGLIREIRDVQVHDTTADLSRAVFGSTLTLGDLKVSVPWTGSFVPGTGLSRTGSNYTWVANYG